MELSSAIEKELPLFNETAPDETVKSELEKDATPLLDAVASSALTVTVPPATCVLTPSPPRKLKLVPRLTSYALELSSPMVIGLFGATVTEPQDSK